MLLKAAVISAALEDDSGLATFVMDVAPRPAATLPAVISPLPCQQERPPSSGTMPETKLARI